MPHEFPISNPAQTPSAEGTQYQHPTGDRLVYDRQGRAYRVVGEYLRDGKRFLQLQSLHPRNGPSRHLAVDKSELGVTLQQAGSQSPVRIIGTKRIPVRQPDLRRPQFADGTPCVGTQDDCLVVDFSANELVKAVVYYDLAAVSGAYPVYECATGYGSPDLTPPVPANVGGDFGPYVPGSDPYNYPYGYGYSGYGFAHRVDLLALSHRVELCGLSTDAVYNVMVCIWDRYGNGPVCSTNMTILLPTP